MTPDHSGTLRELWCLRRSKSDIRCVLRTGMPVEVQILQDRDLVLTELFQEEALAIRWTKAYGDRLRSLGWTDSPVDQSKAS